MRRPQTPAQTRRLLLLAMLAVFALGTRLHGEELRWAIGNDPRSFDPAQVEDGAGETLRYLTGGVLIRLNRMSGTGEPALAEHWSVSADGHLVTITLRPRLMFSDGTPLTAKDVVWSLQHVLDAKTGSSIADEFLAPASVRVQAQGPFIVRLQLPTRLVTLESLLDEIAIQPAGGASGDRVTAGAFVVDSYRRGQAIHLKRNPYYWRHDASGAALPYLPSVQLDIIGNREEEVARFRRGELALIDDLPPEYIAVLDRRQPATARDAGPSLDTEQLWFNQSAAAPLPAWEGQWFRDQHFRVAVSQALHRADFVRAAFAGHATVADSFISPANTRWRNLALRTPRESAADSLQQLHAAGFVTKNGRLFDAAGHAVSFSLMTNAGNTARERMAALIQQDLAAIGIQVNIVTLDFPALIERLLHSHQYEACLLGAINVQPDPATGANVWLSNSDDHVWDPHEPKPATPWEAEIDARIARQAATGSLPLRKAQWDRIQQIVADQQPFIFLVHRDVVFAASPQIAGIRPTPLRPQVLWNIDTWKWTPAK